jgi:hypothetical protein
MNIDVAALSLDMIRLAMFTLSITLHGNRTTGFIRILFPIVFVLLYLCFAKITYTVITSICQNSINAATCLFLPCSFFWLHILQLFNQTPCASSTCSSPPSALGRAAHQQRS